MTGDGARRDGANPAGRDDAAIRTVGLTRTFRGRRQEKAVEALRDVDLVVGRGECFGLLGK